MKLTAGAYLILKLNTNKPELARCTMAEGDNLKAVLEKEKDKDEKSPPVIKFQKSDIMAVLGKRPKVGSVYGLKIEPIVRREHYRGWGDARIYNWFDDHQLELLKDGLDDAYKKLKALRVVGQFKVELEIRQPQGKFAGMYKYRPKAETDILVIKPETNMEDLDYYVFHEYAHGIWYRMMTPKMRLRWIRMYTEYITLQEIKQKELKHILDAVDAEGSVRGFQKGAEDETKAQVKEILKHIMSIHGIGVSHLDMMLENGESIAEYWPTNIEMSEKEVSISDYALKSPEEFFAEAVSFKFLGRRIPKKIEELYEKTMSRLYKGGVDTTEEAPKKKKKDSDEPEKKSKSIRINGDAPELKKKKKKGSRKDGLK